MRTDIVTISKDGTCVDYRNKPKWVSHLESVGIKVDPMAWAKVSNIGQQPCDSVAWTEVGVTNG